MSPDPSCHSKRMVKSRRHQILSRRPCHNVPARAYLAEHSVPRIEYLDYPMRRRGRAAEGGGLLNRYRVVKLYRGFESLRLRHVRHNMNRAQSLREPCAANAMRRRLMWDWGWHNSVPAV